MLPDKPTITHREVSWHSTVAAIRARREAATKSTSAPARHALAIAAAMDPATELSTHPLRPPITIGTLWAIEISGEYDATLVAGSRSADQALWALTLTQPERVLLGLLAGDTADIQVGMIEVAALPAHDYYALDAWYVEQMSLLQTLTGGSAADTSTGKSSDLPHLSSDPSPIPQDGLYAS